MNAYKHGWDCYTHGLSWNPYKIPTTEYDDWFDGWHAAQRTQTSQELRERVVAIFL